jgi:hypothetical protein
MFNTTRLGFTVSYNIDRLDREHRLRATLSYEHEMMISLAITIAISILKFLLLPFNTQLFVLCIL